jgi:phage/plasmid-associated DNA primase
MYDNSTPISGQFSSDISQLLAAINEWPQEWALTPCIGKKNLWPAWQKQRLDRTRLIDVIQSQTNATGKACSWTGVSVVTGALSGGLMAIDFDGSAAFQKYLELGNNQALPVTKKWSSGKPGHFQVLLQVSKEKWEGLRPLKIELPNGDKLELRWNQCSTLPPSIHPETGKPYIWECEAAIAECPDWILKLMRGPASIPLGKKSTQSATVLPQTTEEKSLVELLEEEIIPKIVAEEFYGNYLKLKSSGKKNLKGLCPFHTEKTPSFTVSLENSTYHCFGCGAGGGPVQFLYQLKGHSGSPTGKDFYSVVMELADIVGISIPENNPKTQKPKSKIQNPQPNNDSSNSNTFSISHPRTREDVVRLESDSSTTDYIPDSAPIPEQNYIQKAVEALYSGSHWASVAGQLYKFTGTHYELRPEAIEKRRILDWLNTYSEFVKGKYRCNRANSASVNEVFSYMVLAMAVDPNTINPEGLNTTKGVVKINPDGSHTLLPHDPKQVYTYVGCTYDPDIDATDGDRFLECLEPSHREIFLRTAAAALNLRLVRSKLTGRGVKGLLCHGEGSNGKDTARAILAAIFGRGMTGKSLSDFKSYDMGRKFTLAGIEGSICNWASENTAKVDLDSIQSLKQFITGDPIDIERKGKDSYDYNPTAIFFANCNKLPSITGGTSAIDDRYGILKFDKTYVRNADPSRGELEADPRFKDDENFIRERIAPAILNKMLERLPLLLTEGIDYAATREAMREAQEESRHLWQFVRDLGYQAGKGERVYAKDLWHELQEWYQEAGILELEWNEKGKEKLIWNELPNQWDKPVKAINQLYARLCEIFPKLEKHRYTESVLDSERTKGEAYYLGIHKTNLTRSEKSSPPSSPPCPAVLSSSPPSSPIFSGEDGGEAKILTQRAGEDGEAVSPTLLDFCNFFSKLSVTDKQKLTELLTGSPCSDPLKAFRVGDKVAGNRPEDSSYNWHGRIVEIHTSISCKVDWEEREGMKGGRIISMLFCNLRKI